MKKRTEYEATMNRLRVRRRYYVARGKPVPKELADEIGALRKKRAMKWADDNICVATPREKLLTKAEQKMAGRETEKASPVATAIDPRPEDLKTVTKKIREARAGGVVQIKSNPGTEDEWVKNFLEIKGARSQEWAIPTLQKTTFVTPLDQACEAFAKTNATSLHYVVEEGEGRRLEITITRDKQ